MAAVSSFDPRGSAGYQAPRAMRANTERSMGQVARSTREVRAKYARSTTSLCLRSRGYGAAAAKPPRHLRRRSIKRHKQDIHKAEHFIEISNRDSQQDISTALLTMSFNTFGHLFA